MSHRENLSKNAQVSRLVNSLTAKADSVVGCDIYDDKIADFRSLIDNVARPPEYVQCLITEAQTSLKK